MITSRSASASPARASAAMSSLLALEFLHIDIEPLEAFRPEALIVAQPLRRPFQRRRVEAHRPELRRPAARHEPGALEHLEMLGDGGLAEIRRFHELVHRGLA